MRSRTTIRTGVSHQVDSRRAWSVAVTGSVLNAWTFGVFYAFGNAFEQMAREFDSGLGATAAVFSITTFLFFAGGVVTGPLSDRVGPRPLLALGAVLMGSGLLLTAEVQTLGLGYLTYGVGVGLGIGLYLVPMTACVGGWFDKKRALALGVHTGGIGAGTLLLVPVAEWLIRTEGWRSAFRWLGLGTLVVYGAAALLVARPPVAALTSAAADAPREKREKSSARTAMALSSFKRLYLAGFLMSVPLFASFVFIVKYATDRGVAKPAAAALISIIGIGSVVGRLGLGALGTKVSTAKLSFLCYVVQPFGYLVWLLADGRYWMLVVFAAVLGFAYGGYVALSPVLAADFYGLDGLGSILGVLYTSAGIGGLIGPIAVGMLLDQTNDFSLVLAMSIGLTSLSALVFGPLRHAQD